jgi:hypothetical protein
MAPLTTPCRKRRVDPEGEVGQPDEVTPRRVAKMAIFDYLDAFHNTRLLHSASATEARPILGTRGWK